MMPWRAARALYEVPVESGPKGEAISRLGFWRSALGLVTVVVVGFTFGKDPWSSAVDNSVDVAVNAMVSIAAMVVCVAGIYLVTQTGRRRTLLRGTRTMVRNFVVLVSTVVAPVALIDYVALPKHDELPLLLVLVVLVGGPLSCIPLAYLARRRRMPARTKVVWVLMAALTVVLVVLTASGVRAEDPSAKLLVPLAGVLPAAWWMLYFPCAIYWMARTVMWVGAVHPMLAPIGAVLLVAITFSGKIGHYRADGVPFNIWTAMAVTGLVSTFVVAVIEVRHLRKTGIGLRSGAHAVTLGTFQEGRAPQT
jgi:hypothetical protein